jgi:hypothetical protein
MNRRIPNGMYGGVRGRELITPSYPILSTSSELTKGCRQGVIEHRKKTTYFTVVPRLEIGYSAVTASQYLRESRRRLPRPPYQTAAGTSGH